MVEAAPSALCVGAVGNVELECIIVYFAATMKSGSLPLGAVVADYAVEKIVMPKNIFPAIGRVGAAD
jgi:hypothetical protein